MPASSTRFVSVHSVRTTTTFQHSHTTCMHCEGKRCAQREFYLVELKPRDLVQVEVHYCLLTPCAAILHVSPVQRNCPLLYDRAEGAQNPPCTFSNSSLAPTESNPTLLSLLHRVQIQTLTQPPVRTPRLRVLATHKRRLYYTDACLQPVQPFSHDLRPQHSRATSSHSTLQQNTPDLQVRRRR